jgi:hypothetical protein
MIPESGLTIAAQLEVDPRRHQAEPSHTGHRKHLDLCEQSPGEGMMLKMLLAGIDVDR